jgi:hypothetical protein
VWVSEQRKSLTKLAPSEGRRYSKKGLPAARHVAQSGVGSGLSKAKPSPPEQERGPTLTQLPLPIPRAASGVSRGHGLLHHYSSTRRTRASSLGSS